LQSVLGDLGHEQIVFCNDAPTGLKAIIAIHNTVLGPGMGGTRFWDYATDEDAITDVMRLSRGMTYKNALAGLNAGGGKAVIIGSQNIKSEALLRRFGRFIDNLTGSYVTTEDVGMSALDMVYIGMETPFVTGLPEVQGGGGDPSPVTAYGVYMGIKAAAKKTYGSDDLSGKKIFVQGVGHVGGQLVKLLIKETAKVFISDVNEERVLEIAKTYKAEVVDASNWLDLEMDIYAPCAFGATLNSETIPGLRCRIIAGGANNQLEDEELHAHMLQERGIMYAPDFLINSGGIINVYMEYKGNYHRELAYQKTEDIYQTCLDLIERAEIEGVTTHQAALQMAKDRISAMGKVKLSF
jgi:leucine dehydrogenase